MKCPKCKRGTVRAKVHLFLDIPMSRWGRLGKAALRSAEIQVDGAGWPTALLYCSKPLCGWIEKRGREGDPILKAAAGVVATAMRARR